MQTSIPKGIPNGETYEKKKHSINMATFDVPNNTTKYKLFNPWRQRTGFGAGQGGGG